jgi:electron transfer flavoprotein beta subunit
MKVLVAVKRVIDHNVRVRLEPGANAVACAGVKMSLNPFDETAVEEAVRLKEKGRAGEIVAVSIGPAAAAESLRTALAMGADRALLIETVAAVEPETVAKILQIVCAAENPDLVLVGRQAIDDDAAQVGPRLAMLMGWAQGVGVSEIVAEAPQTVRVRTEVETGAQCWRLRLPAVVSVDLRLNTPRYVTLPGILKAKKKPLHVRPVADYAAAVVAVRRVGLAEPPARRAGRMAADAADFAAALMQAGGKP